MSYGFGNPYRVGVCASLRFESHVLGNSSAIGCGVVLIGATKTPVVYEANRRFGVAKHSS